MTSCSDEFYQPLRIEFTMGRLWEMAHYAGLWWPTRTVEIGVN